MTNPRRPIRWGQTPSGTGSEATSTFPIWHRMNCRALLLLKAQFTVGANSFSHGNARFSQCFSSIVRLMGEREYFSRMKSASVRLSSSTRIGSLP